MDEDELFDTLPMAIRTRRGLFFLLIGLSLAVLGLLLTVPPISIVGHFLTLCGYILIPLGAYFIYSGRKVKEGIHRKMAAIGFYIILSTMLILLLINLYRFGMVMREFSDTITSGMYGSEVVNLFEERAPMIWIEALMVLIGATGSILLIWNITSRLGRIFLILFIVATIGSVIGGAILLQSALNDHVDDIDGTELFSEKEIVDMERELTMKMYPSTLMRLTDLLLLIIALVPAFRMVNERVKKSYITG